MAASTSSAGVTWPAWHQRGLGGGVEPAGLLGHAAHGGPTSATAAGPRARRCDAWAMAMPVTACPLDCPDTCSLEVTVEDGRASPRSTPRPGNPLTPGLHLPEGEAPRPTGSTGRSGSSRRSCAPARRARAVPRRPPGTRRSTSSAARIRAAIAERRPGQRDPLLYNSSAGVLASAALTDRAVRAASARPRCAHTICAATAGAGVGRHLRRHALGRSARRRRTPASSWCGAPTRPCRTPTSRRSCTEAEAAGARLMVIDPRRTGDGGTAPTGTWRCCPGTDVVLA